ncbi:MAG: hypothetical protein AAF399_18175 [Bacteroidota bacterium]
MSYARARIWLAVGQWVMIGTLAGTIWGANGWEWIAETTAGHSPYGWLAVILLGYSFLLLPFDWVGGHVLPNKHGRSTRSLGRWLLNWVRGMSIQTAYLWISGSLLMIVSDWLGFGGTLIWLGFSMFVLVAIRLYLAVTIAPLRLTPTSHRGRFLNVIDSPDKSFTGGLTGFPGMASLVMPQYWQERFSEGVYEVLLARRHGLLNTGHYGRGILMAVFWNVGLFALASWLAPQPLSSLSGLLQSAGFFTLFVSLGQLGFLPWLSRRAVFDMDRWLYFKKLDGDDIRAAIDKTDRLQEDLQPVLKSLHPLVSSTPGKAARLAQLQQQKTFRGAWQAAAISLYLSWAGMNLLGRSMPIQLGRTELWVYPPGD